MTTSAPALVAEPPVIHLAGVGLVYPGPPPVPALRRADLVVRRGDFVAVVGPSGSGKSTLLNVLGLLDTPTAGRYELDGLDTGELSEAKRTALRGERIGFVFQAFHLMPYRTALENVLLASIYRPGRLKRRQRQRNRMIEREAAAQTLGNVGLSDRIFALPSTLSGGERQRVAIARGLVGNPSLLLCDEPTGNLDTATAQSIITLLEDLNHGGVTIVVITHDHAVASRAHRTVEIRDGILRETTDV